MLFSLVSASIDELNRPYIDMCTRQLRVP
jgi:hypothetical protein